MKTLTLILCIFSLTSYGLAQAPEAAAVASGKEDGPSGAAGKTIGQLSSAANKELAKSIEDLNRLRDKIAAEKLPLSEKLTGMEEELTKLRSQYENVTRQADAGNLEITTLKAEMKARQDELVYITNLLDEYARAFESKVNVSELQYVGEDMEAAKQATENTTLSKADRFDRQVKFVNVSLKRLGEAIGGMRFPGVGVDMQGNLVDGQYAIIGPVALFRAKNGSTAGLVLPQTGSTRPLIRPLEGEMQSGLASLVENGEGLMPLDPTRGGALKAIVHKTDLAHIFKKGGPIMWPLSVAAVLALLTVLERVFFLLNEKRKRDPKAMDLFFATAGQGNVDGAIHISMKSKFYVLRALGYALTHRERSLSNALLYAQEQEMKRFRRGIPVLDTVITLAPLLGLLGTVTGMMGSFSLIGGELSAPGAITGGIAEALIATAFGLGIAIISLIPFNYLNTKMEEARIEIETAASQLELLVHPSEISDEAVVQDLLGEK